VTNLRQLVHLVHEAVRGGAPFFVFQLEFDEVVVLDAAEALASTPEILRVHNIPKAMSRDLSPTSEEGEGESVESTSS
jgi:hypothetical protein